MSPEEEGIGMLMSKDYIVDPECNSRCILGEKNRLIVIGNIEKIKRFLESYR